MSSVVLNLQIRQQLFRLLLRCLSNQFELLLNLQQRAEKIVQLTIDGYRIPRQEEVSTSTSMTWQA